MQSVIIVEVGLFFFKGSCHSGLGSAKTPFQPNLFSSKYVFDSSNPSVAPNSKKFLISYFLTRREQTTLEKVEMRTNDDLSK